MPDQTPPLPAWATEECVEAVARAIDHGAFLPYRTKYEHVRLHRLRVATEHARAAIRAAGPFVERYTVEHMVKTAGAINAVITGREPAPAPQQSRE